MVVPTTLWIPVADVQLQLGWGYYVLAFLIIVGATNAVNLTDGLMVLQAVHPQWRRLPSPLLVLWLHL